MSFGVFHFSHGLYDSRLHDIMTGMRAFLLVSGLWFHDLRLTIMILQDRATALYNVEYEINDIRQWTSTFVLHLRLLAMLITMHRSETRASPKLFSWGKYQAARRAYVIMQI
jgi:hypothetical protein